MTIRTDLAGRLKDGRAKARSDYKGLESSKMGTLRAGNSGIMSKEGDVVGACHRLTHLRSLGLQIDDVDDSKLIMFQMGTANEDVVYEDLLHTAAPDEVVLREEQIPITWLTPNGTKVTGRPDMVVCRKASPDEDAKGRGLVMAEGVDSPLLPIFGVELKSIASIWTTRDVIGEQKPKMEHLIQAAHYSWQLGVPFRLLYKQYSIQEIPGWKGAKGSAGWTQKLFPTPGAPGSEFIDYEKGRIQPFEICYELEFTKVTEGFLRYRREGSSDAWVKTLVSTDDLKRYYQFVSEMAATGDLGSRPLNIGPDGKEKSWSKCDQKYCPLAGTCDRYEGSGYSKWLAEVKKVHQQSLK